MIQAILVYALNIVGYQTMCVDFMQAPGYYPRTNFFKKVNYFTPLLLLASNYHPFHDRDVCANKANQEDSGI
jgi:hypothetical protein